MDIIREFGKMKMHKVCDCANIQMKKVGSLQYFLMTIVVFSVFVQHIFQKQYNQKNAESKNANLLFLVFLVVSASVVLGILFCFNRAFTPESIPYTLCFAVCFCATFFGQLQAIKYGPLSLTALFNAFALVLPTIFGLVVLQEKLSAFGVFGLVCLGVALLLVNRVEKGAKFNRRWLFYALLTLLGNGGCQVVQKMHQMYVVGEYAVSFQFLAMLESAAVMSIMLLIVRPKDTGAVLKRSGGYIVLSGIANVVANILMLVLAVSLPAAILYPTASAGGIALTFVAALLVYKERFTLPQYIGYGLGTLAVVLLSL